MKLGIATIVIALFGWGFMFGMGCAAALPAIQSGVAILGAVLDAAELGTDRYLDRHPSQGTQEAVDEVLARARAAEKAYKAAATPENKQRMLDDYDELRSLLKALGVLDGTAPEGGAETEAPEPKPLHLPTRTELSEVL